MVAIAAFVTAHGYGHAARACAVLDAVGMRLPGVRVEVFTDAPAWFFEASLQLPFRIHEVRGDVGLVQRSALDADVEATVRSLDALLPLDDALVASCAEALERSGCRAVVTDIAPLGVAVGRRARVPTVLVENFTWDWIYRQLDRPPDRLLEHAAALDDIYRGVDLRLRAQPACGDAHGRPVPLIWRPSRTAPSSVRRRLEIPSERAMVLVSMGGARWNVATALEAAGGSTVTYVVPGGEDTCRRSESVIPLSSRSEFFHPDLVAAADVVVGKLGYSTVAEAVGAGTAFAWVPRDDFPESPILEAFVRRRVPSAPIDRGRFETGDWGATVEQLVSGRRRSACAAEVNGADIAADEIVALLAGGSPSWNPGDLRHSPGSS